LHDSVGQLLAAIGMNSVLVEAESHKLSAPAAKGVCENTEMVKEVSKQIRTISYLLHPPLLDEVGLGSALRCYVEGFSERSQIDVKIDVPGDLVRLSQEIELSMFRVVQECLTNIHRHSGSPTARIRITEEGASVRVDIEDAGKGMQLERNPGSPAHSGVGLRGMRERLRLLGGTLHICSDSHGTRATAMLPTVRATRAVPSVQEGERPVAIASEASISDESGCARQRE
jgi:signal transduction histidine kinase